MGNKRIERRDKWKICEMENLRTEKRKKCEKWVTIKITRESVKCYNSEVFERIP